jgi:hypothetical protein
MSPSARATLQPVIARALGAFAVLAALAAGGLVVLAQRDDPSDTAVLEVEPVVVDVTPSTVPPLVAAADLAAADDSADASADDSDDGAGAPTSGLSPLAALVGPRASAIPPDVAARSLPTSVTIDGISLWSAVRPVGLEPNGEMEIPDEAEVGWYRYGSTPGREGATVLAAHVTWKGRIGPFHRLGALDPGALVEVTLDDGSVRTYQVVERAMYGKFDLPAERIWRRDGPEELVLITCGGEFDSSIRRYRDNIVVYAVPVA